MDRGLWVSVRVGDRLHGLSGDRIALRFAPKALALLLQRISQLCHVDTCFDGLRRWLNVSLLELIRLGCNSQEHSTQPKQQVFALLHNARMLLALHPTSLPLHANHLTFTGALCVMRSQSHLLPLEAVGGRVQSRCELVQSIFHNSARCVSSFVVCMSVQ